jgi:hypothetical protein
MNTVPCKGCGKPIIFLKTKAGKTMPLDARAAVYEVKKDFSGQPYADLVSEGFHVSHFLTCTKANDFSSSNRKEQ